MLRLVEVRAAAHHQAQRVRHPEIALALVLVLLDVVRLERPNPGLPEHGRKRGLVPEVFRVRDGADSPRGVQHLRRLRNLDFPAVPHVPDLLVTEILVERLRPVPDHPLPNQRIRHVGTTKRATRGHRGDLLEEERDARGRELLARFGDPVPAAGANLLKECGQRPILGIHKETQQMDRLVSPLATHLDPGNQLDPTFRGGDPGCRDSRQGVVVGQRQHGHPIPSRGFDG